MNATISIVFANRDYGSSQELIRATLTTDHAASSYGLPVVSIHGEAYGPEDLDAMRDDHFHWIQIDERVGGVCGGDEIPYSSILEAKRLAKMAGYRVRHW